MSYAIPDEPRPTRLAHLAVRPHAPLLAAMLCGAWLAWPWFAFNAIAIGSPTRRRELALCALGLGGTAALAALLIALIHLGVIDSRTSFQIALLVIATWKLGLAYAVCIVQARTFDVYEHYGGTVRAATPVLAAGFLLRPVVLGLIDDPLWVIIVAGGV